MALSGWVKHPQLLQNFMKDCGRMTFVNPHNCSCTAESLFWEYWRIWEMLNLKSSTGVCRRTQRLKILWASGKKQVERPNKESLMVQRFSCWRPAVWVISEWLNEISKLEVWGKSVLIKRRSGGASSSFCLSSICLRASWNCPNCGWTSWFCLFHDQQQSNKEQK